MLWPASGSHCLVAVFCAGDAFACHTKKTGMDETGDYDEESKTLKFGSEGEQCDGFDLYRYTIIYTV